MNRNQIYSKILGNQLKFQEARKKKFTIEDGDIYDGDRKVAIIYDDGSVDIDGLLPESDIKALIKFINTDEEFMYHYGYEGEETSYDIRPQGKDDDDPFYMYRFDVEEDKIGDMDRYDRWIVYLPTGKTVAELYDDGFVEIDKGLEDNILESLIKFIKSRYFKRNFGDEGYSIGPRD